MIRAIIFTCFISILFSGCIKKASKKVSSETSRNAEKVQDFFDNALKSKSDPNFAAKLASQCALFNSDSILMLEYLNDKNKTESNTELDKTAVQFRNNVIDFCNSVKSSGPNPNDNLLAKLEKLLDDLTKGKDNIIKILPPDFGKINYNIFTQDKLTQLKNAISSLEKLLNSLPVDKKTAELIAELTSIKNDYDKLVKFSETAEMVLGFIDQLNAIYAKIDVFEVKVKSALDASQIDKKIFDSMKNLMENRDISTMKIN